jgi:hypothetical protein
MTKALSMLAGLGMMVLGGCDSRVLTPDDGTGTGDGGGATGAAGAGGTTGSGGTGSVSLPQTCPAACGTPAGAVYTFSSDVEVATALTGRWQICAGRGNTFPAPADMIGVEFGSASVQQRAFGPVIGGDLYYLVAGANGPERGAGFDYQLTYDVTPLGPGAFQLNMHPTPNSGFGGSPRYSPCPHEFEISGGSAAPADRAILVSF